MPDYYNNLANEEGIRLFGLIGYPLTHSFSKKYFEEKFKHEELFNCRFENFSIQSINDLNHILQQYKNELKGLAVTIPYKQQVFKMLDDSTAIPDEMKTVNCIKIVNSKLIGYNTDWIGFQKSFTPLLKADHKKALVLGNGGASIAVAYVLKNLAIDFEIVSRTPHYTSTLTYSELTDEIINNHTIIINTTPLGTFPAVNEFPLIPYTGITAEHYLFDLVYNPEKTMFLQKGETAGATIKNGADMLKLQAEENWIIWNS